MKKNFTSLMIILGQVLLSACGPSPAEEAATTTAIAAEVYATQTAGAPTATRTPMGTPTFTATPTNTLTPKPTRTPTSTPTPTSEKSWTSLWLEDLPPGFMEIPADDFADAIGDEAGGDSFTFDDAFMFVDIEHFNILVGFTISVPTTMDQVGFDLLVNQPDIMADLFISGVQEGGGSEILSREEYAESEGWGMPPAILQW
jgi:hypothetical protein